MSRTTHIDSYIYNDRHWFRTINMIVRPIICDHKKWWPWPCVKIMTTLRIVSHNGGYSRILYAPQTQWAMWKTVWQAKITDIALKVLIPGPTFPTLNLTPRVTMWLAHSWLTPCTNSHLPVYTSTEIAIFELHRMQCRNATFKEKLVV